MNIPSMKRALAIFLSWLIVVANSDLGFCINLVGAGKASSVNPHGITKIPADQCTIFSLGTNRLIQFFQVQEPASQDAGIDLIVAETDNGNILDLHPAHASVQPTHLRPGAVTENLNPTGNSALGGVPGNLTIANLSQRTIRHDPAHGESRPGDTEPQPAPMDEAGSRIAPIISYVSPLTHHVAGLPPSATLGEVAVAGAMLQNAVSGEAQYVGSGFVSVDSYEAAPALLPQRLENLSRHYAQVLSMVTHDFMSPATIISAYTDLANAQLSSANGLIGAIQNLGLKNEDLDRLLRLLSDSLHRIGGFLSEVHKGVNMMLEVRAATASLVSLAKGRYTPGTKKFDIGDMLRQEIANKQGLVETRNQTINIKIDIPTPVYVNADPITLRRVVDNLLSNAIKYSAVDAGWIIIRVFPHPEKNDHVVISVQDNGMGIKQSDLSRLGEELGFRTDLAGQIQGTGIGFDSGIGLHTVRQILRAHGVDLTVESAGEGLGSTFSFPLPLWVEP